MNGLVELIFEEVPDAAVNLLICALLNGTVEREIQHSELGAREAKEIGGKYLELLRMTEGPASIFLKAAESSIGGVIIGHPLVRVLRCQDSNEVAFVFDSRDVRSSDRKDAVVKMALGAKVLAQRSNVTKFYCGFEPATDEKTRLFAEDVIGPLTAV
jgi:hypothetical protein